MKGRGCAETKDSVRYAGEGAKGLAILTVSGKGPCAQGFRMKNCSCDNSGRAS